MSKQKENKQVTITFETDNILVLEHALQYYAIVLKEADDSIKNCEVKIVPKEIKKE